MNLDVYNFDYSDKSYWFFDLTIIPFGYLNRDDEVIIDDYEIDFKHAEAIDDNDNITYLTKDSPEFKQIIDVILKDKIEQLEEEFINDMFY